MSTVDSNDLIERLTLGVATTLGTVSNFPTNQYILKILKTKTRLDFSYATGSKNLIMFQLLSLF